jgi:hypothetical protein
LNFSYILESLTCTIQQVDDLADRHNAEIPSALVVKNESVKDLLTIFSDLVVVKFTKGDRDETVKGRWCLVCR